MEQPFIGSYFVDPNFSGTSTGSSDSPFTTIADAFAFALSLSLHGAVVFLPPSGLITEDVVFPDLGDWEISCQDTSRLSVISGTVSGSTTASSTATAPKYRLTNVTVTGAISVDAGNAPNSFLVLTNSKINNSVSLNASGSGNWVLQCIGRCSDANSFGGFIAGTASVVGAIHATDWSFQSPMSFAGANSQFDNCRVQGSISSVASALNSLRFSDCTFTSSVNISASNPLVVQIDGPSFSSAANLGLVLSSNVTLKTINGNNSAAQTISNNVTPLNISGRVPVGMYQFATTLDLLSNGVGASGNATANVTYTDLIGVLRTVPVTELDVTLPVGSQAHGTFLFSTNGATPPQYSVSGITTGPGLSIAVRVASQKVD